MGYFIAEPLTVMFPLILNIISFAWRINGSQISVSLSLFPSLCSPSSPLARQPTVSPLVACICRLQIGFRVQLTSILPCCIITGYVNVGRRG